MVISQHSTLVWAGGRKSTHRAVVARDVCGLIELLEDVLRKDFAELDAHLVWSTPIRVNC